MKQVLRKAAFAASTVVFGTLLSVSWSEQGGARLGVENAQAQSNRSSTHSRNTAGVRRQYPRSGSGRRLLAEAVASTTTPWNYDDYYCYDNPYAGWRNIPVGYYYRSYPGGYCLRSGDVTGLYARPTLFPRYYGDWSR
jgi:hypothetical protein